MKANRAYVNRNDRAEVGVGTLIVFIAMVLVAAVAAAVLINTTGTLQQRAQATGKEATQEVASNLKVAGVYGVRNNTGAKIWDVKINVELSAGAVPIDMTKVIVRYAQGNLTRNYNHSAAGADFADASAGQTWFTTTWIRGAGSNSVMAPGDLVELHLNLATTEIEVRTPVEITLIPEVGSSVRADFKTPSTYGTSTVVTLR